MKFIHAADIHLDSPLRGLVRYAGTPSGQGQNVTRMAFINLVELACQEKVDFVLLAGDLYDDDWKDYNTGLFFNQQMARLKDCNIKVFVVYGNHDAANVITKQLILPDNVIKFSAEQAHTSYALEHLGVVVHGQSFATRAVNDNLSANYPEAIAGLYNIGLLHTSLDGREGHGNYAPAKIADLLAKDYDYWALGHVHRHEVVHTNPHIVFAGNLQGRNVRETGAKGCTLVTVNDGYTHITQCSLDVLRWEICRIKADDIIQPDDLIDNIQQELTHKIEHAQGRTLALRFSIEGQTPIHNELHVRSERWLQDIRSLATEIGGGNIWVEKVKFSTQAPNSKQINGNENKAALDDLLRTMRALPQEHLSAELHKLYKILPTEVIRNGFKIDPEHPDTIRTTLNHVEDMLLARLLTNK